MEKEAFRALLKRYEEGQCSPEEKAYVETWFLHTAAAAPDIQGETDYDHIDEELRARIGISEPPQQIKSLYKWLAASAAIILLAAAGYFFLDPTAGDGRPAPYIADVEPGRSRATLTLADGRVVELSSDHSGIIVSDDIRYDDGTAIETPLHHASSIIHHSLVTPKGGQYKVRLPDGTMVWLNAETRLEYPSQFTGTERVVTISGEAYFEVAASKDRPFKVRSSGQEVTVLGTAFNIHTYSSETRTTLASGSVRVHLSENSAVTEVLRPGEQSIFNGQSLIKKKVNLTTEVAWKEGLFSYADTRLEEVMQDLARWYDLEFSITPRAAALKLDAEISRDLMLSEVLKLLQLSVQVEIIVEGRRLTVK